LLSWYAASDSNNDTLTYEVQVDEAGEDWSTLVGSTPDPPNGNTDELQWLVTTELIDGQWYQWRVRAYDGVKSGDWSETWTFLASSSGPFQGYFSPALGIERFTILNDEGLFTTEFTQGEKVWVIIQTERVEDADGGYHFYLLDYLNNSIDISSEFTFTQVSATSPYEYMASFVIPESLPDDYYTLKFDVRESALSGEDQFDASVILSVGENPSHYLKTYSDHQYTIESSNFDYKDQLFIKVIGTTIGAQLKDSLIIIRDYVTGTPYINRGPMTLTNKGDTHEMMIQLWIAEKPYLPGTNWYSLEVIMMRGDTLVFRGATQIRITAP
jgi:hypothetical protein